MPSLFSVPLQGPPLLVQSGFSIHGKADESIIEHYRLPGLWCLHLYDYAARMEIDGEEFELKPGAVSLVPPNRQLTYHYNGFSPHLYTHFSLGSPDKTIESTTVPVAKYWYEPSEIPTPFHGQMKNLVGAHARELNGPWQVRANVALWEMLWQLCELTPQNTPDSSLHPCLQKSLAIIEARIGESINVAALAHEVGLSHNQLTRLFMAHTNQTVVAYIRSRRAYRASHLLRNSTLSIKSIAAQVGTLDLGQFNHLMRRETGQSPRTIRFGSDTVE